MTERFRAIWPLVHPGVTWSSLVKQAEGDLPMLAAQAHCRIVGRPTFRVVESEKVPGSGRSTSHVFVCDVPAEPVRRVLPTAPTVDRTYAKGSRACERCGIVRETSRKTPLCRDCRAVESVA